MITGKVPAFLRAFTFHLGLQILIPLVVLAVLALFYTAELPGLEIIIIGCALVITFTFCRTLVLALRRSKVSHG